MMNEEDFYKIMCKYRNIGDCEADIIEYLRIHGSVSLNYTKLSKEVKHNPNLFIRKKDADKPYDVANFRHCVLRLIDSGIVMLETKDKQNIIQLDDNWMYKLLNNDVKLHA